MHISIEEGTTENKKYAKILIADDHEKICQMPKEHLENEGYECLTAKSGLEALEIFHKEQV